MQSNEPDAAAADRGSATALCPRPELRSPACCTMWCHCFVLRPRGAEDGDPCKRDDDLLALTPACAARGILFVDQEQLDDDDGDGRATAEGSGRSTYPGQESSVAEDAPSEPGSPRGSSRASGLLDRLSARVSSNPPEREQGLLGNDFAARVCARAGETD